MLLNALDYGSLEAAIDDASSGDRIYVPGGTPWVAPAGTNGWQITKSVELFGDGPGDASDGNSGTVLVPGSETTDVLTVWPPAGTEAPAVYIHDLQIRPPASAVSEKYGAHGIRGAFSKGAIVVERVRVARMTQYGLFVEGGQQESDVIERASMAAVSGTQCGLWGGSYRNVRMLRNHRCSYGGNSGGGLRCTNSGVALQAVNVEDNVQSPQMLMEGCRPASIEACRFESHTVTNFVGLELENCRGAVNVMGCFFAIQAAVSGAAGIVVNATSRAIAILTNKMTRLNPDLIRVAGGATGGTIMPQYNNPNPNLELGNIIVDAGDVFGEPRVARLGDGPPDSSAGLLLSTRAGDPTTTVPNGTIFLDTNGAGRLRAMIGGVWKTVQVTPP